MDSKPNRLQFSLRTLLFVVLSAGLLFGLTFKAYSDSPPAGRWVEQQVRGETPPPGKRLTGNFSTYGLPFANYEIGETWVLGDREPTVRNHERFLVSGCICNLLFWLALSGGLSYLLGRIHLIGSPTRQFFRFHLSTFVLLALVAGLCVGMNFHIAHESRQIAWQVENRDCRGWPMTWSENFHCANDDGKVVEYTARIPAIAYAVDVAMGMGICFCVALLSESTIRRHVHLLTAALLTILSVVILWANVYGRHALMQMSSHQGRLVNVPYSEVGWPLAYDRHTEGVIFYADFMRYYISPSPSRIGLNVLIVISIMLAVALISESILRRREARKP